MARPIKARHVFCNPGATYFKPRGVPVRELDEIILSVDELEAVRLADLEGLYQDEAAKIMKISRQTFGNIVYAAHRKIANALVNGKALRIEGGIVTMSERKFRCNDCKHLWNLPFGTGRPSDCPKCHGKSFHREAQNSSCKRDGGFGEGRGRRRRATV